MSEDLLAAVDLGSNSFRLLVGKRDGDQIMSVSTWREGVRLAGGLDEKSLLSEAKIVEAEQALARFRERIAAVSSSRVRAVATNTYRVAKNAKELLSRSERALGAKIEVVSGTEEARLIYVGCAHSLPWSEADRLIVDIGGGSTEFVIGRGYEPTTMESFPLGAVTLSQHFFPDGTITDAAFRKADVFVRSRLEVMRQEYKRGWEIAYGSSGTVRALYEIINENDLGGVMSMDALLALREELVSAGRMDRVSLNALKSNRAPVLPGGLAILIALMRELNVDRVDPADGALRLGILYDLIERERGRSPGAHYRTDTRSRTIERLQRRYDVDMGQVERVEVYAQRLWQSLGHEENDALLSWGAGVHEIGMAVSHEDYHRHSAYIVEHSDLAGFSENERYSLVQLVLGHTGSLKKLDRSEFDDESLMRLLCIRIAAIFAHGRNDVPSAASLLKKNGTLTLRLPATKKSDRPLTWSLLEEEQERCRKWGIELAVQS